jgi:predicted dehydrogenase
VYSQNAWGARRETHGAPDTQYLLVTMDDGTVVNVGAGMSLPPGYPNQSSTWIEVLGTKGAVIADATYRDIVLNTVERGAEFPLSTMPGEYVDHMYAGPMERETTHFLEAVAHDWPVMVDPHAARTTMEVYIAADLSAMTNEAVSLPLSPAEVKQALGELYVGES